MPDTSTSGAPAIAGRECDSCRVGGGAGWAAPKASRAEMTCGWTAAPPGLPGVGKSREGRWSRDEETTGKATRRGREGVRSRRRDGIENR